MRLHDLMQQLIDNACILTLSTIRNFETIEPEKQDENKATLCKKIKRSDGEIDFENAETIYNKYRAFEGWPGVFSSNSMKFDDIDLLDTQSRNSNSVILAFEDDSVIVGCSIGALKVGTLQPASKKPMTAKAYCLGRGLQVGDTID